MTPVLTDVDGLIRDLFDGAVSLPATRARLRRIVGHHLPADTLDDLIADATACWSDVCDFQPGGGRDWRTYLEREHVAGDGQVAALEHAEDEYGHALMALARGGERRMGVAV